MGWMSHVVAVKVVEAPGARAAPLARAAPGARPPVTGVGIVPRGRQKRVVIFVLLAFLFLGPNMKSAAAQTKQFDAGFDTYFVVACRTASPHFCEPVSKVMPRRTSFAFEIPV